MKIKLNAEGLRMVVLKQIVANASIAMKIERKINIFERIFPLTPRVLRLRRLRVRGDKLQDFETALSLVNSDLVEIDYHDVNFIYEGLR